MEIYEYQHYTTINNEINQKIITESATAYSVKDIENNIIIYPKKKVNNFFELSEREQFACILVLNRTKYIMEKKLHINYVNFQISQNSNSFFLTLKRRSNEQ